MTMSLHYLINFVEKIVGFRYERTEELSMNTPNINSISQTLFSV